MTKPSQIEYPGGELESFAAAVRWKQYAAERMQPHIRGRVLECGAGLGSNTNSLFQAGCSDWLCLEPDPTHVEVLKKKSASGELPGSCRVQLGTLADLRDEARFDTIIYYDVLEHIEDDRAELIKAFNHLLPGGCLIILAPAHQSLFSAFDKAIGHYRRYDKVSLHRIMPAGLQEIKLQYLDSCGFLAYKAFGKFTKKSNVSAGNVQLWDKILVPISRLLDPLFGHSLGKSILAIFRK